jgi:hypothetical protein
MGKQLHQLHKSPSPWLLVGLLSGLSAFAGTTMALGPVVDGNLRAESLCIDPDTDNCPTVANDGEVRLEADTVRIRFLDSTAGNTTKDGLGNSWSLLANDYSGAGEKAQTYFGFTLRSLDPTPDDDGNDILGKHVLRLGPSTSTNGSAGAVAIGLDSEFAEGVVSLGTVGFQRRLVHVAAALEETDALIKRQLEEGLLGSLGDIADRLDEMEDEVAALERRVDSDGGGSSSGGGGGGGLVGIPTLVFLAALLGITGWRRALVG